VKRREFITLLGGATVAWPLAARAQQPEPMRRIGVLLATAADEPESQARLAAFLQGLQQLGWTDGRNVRIDYRWRLRGNGNPGALRPAVFCPAGRGPATKRQSRRVMAETIIVQLQ
jgi:hypothetical protein